MLFQINHTNIRLAGSMHMVPRGRQIPDWVESTYEWCRGLYLEHDARALIPRMLLPPDQTSEHLLPPELWTQLKALWPEELGPLARWKPFMISSLVSLLMTSKEPGVEGRLNQLARLHAKPVRYLETDVEAQSFAEAVPNSLYVEEIRQILENPANSAQKSDALYEAWNEGNIEKITELLISTQLMNSPLAWKVLIDDRNALWLDRILATLESPQPTMIAVGAAHLGGENGLLQLLERGGYSLGRLA